MFPKRADVEQKKSYLTRPERDERAEGEAGVGSGETHLGDGSTEGNGESARRAGLDLDLGHFERAKGNVGEELGRGRASQPDSTLVLGGGLLAGEVHVVVFEEFVQTVLEHALEGVADERGAETFPETTAALLSSDGAETGNEALILARAHLKRSSITWLDTSRRAS